MRYHKCIFTKMCHLPICGLLVVRCTVHVTANNSGLQGTTLQCNTLMAVTTTLSIIRQETPSFGSLEISDDAVTDLTVMEHLLIQ